MTRLQRHAAAWLAVLALGHGAAGCAPPCDVDADCPEGSGCRAGTCATECASNNDCPTGTDCSPNHLCGPPAAGDIVWLSPLPGEVVDTSFDAELEVSFRAASSTLTIERSGDDPGDRCAPFVPFRVDLLGDLQQHLTQRITVPSLLSFGEAFALRATMTSSGGTVVRDLHLAGPPSGTGGARFTQPEAERAVNAAELLTLDVSAELDRSAAAVSMWVAPLGGAPGPIATLGPGLTAIAAQPVSLAHGPQVIWLEADDGARCGLGIDGTALDTAAGLELALSYRAQQPAALGLQLLVEAGATSSTCDFVAPGTTCEAVRETVAPDVRGEQVLRVPMGDGVVNIAVVPNAASGYVTAEVRVTLGGVHVGWLGPYPMATSEGEGWIAGQVLVSDGVARLVRTDEVTQGAPW